MGTILTGCFICLLYVQIKRKKKKNKLKVHLYENNLLSQKQLKYHSYRQVLYVSISYIAQTKTKPTSSFHDMNRLKVIQVSQQA